MSPIVVSFTSISIFHERTHHTLGETSEFWFWDPTKTSGNAKAKKSGNKNFPDPPPKTSYPKNHENLKPRGLEIP